MTCAWIDTSSAETGSSATISFGFSASARAIEMRCRWPPENSCGKALHLGAAQPDLVEELGDQLARFSLPRAMPWTSSGSPTMSPADMRGFSDENGSWKMICICRR